MKTLLGVLALALAATACQKTDTTSDEALAATRTSQATTALPVATAQAATLPPALLRQFDLAPLWQGRYESNSPSLQEPMDGFFGDDYRRIAFFFTEAHRDGQQPGLYHVKGKNRFQKTISPFEGTITITGLTPMSPAMADSAGYMELDSTCRVYSAKAVFSFREQPEMASTAGEFSGTGHLDFYLDGKGKLQMATTLMYDSPIAPARGAGILYQGQWVSYRTHARKPLLLSGNVFTTAPPALHNFGIGDRGDMFNPKYAKLGWNDYWQNDEWWAEAPKPTL
ncbi:MAG: hypothetical protein ACRYFX_28310 [Janthinobacterium lividum]